MSEVPLYTRQAQLKAPPPPASLSETFIDASATVYPHPMRAEETTLPTFLQDWKDTCTYHKYLSV